VTQTAGNISTAIATTAFVGGAVSTAVGASVADAISDGTTTIAPSQNAVFDALALKASLASPAITGTPHAPTATSGTNTTQLATTAFVTAANTINANLKGMVTSVGNIASLGSFTSANLATAITNETGIGAAVFATSPTLVTPVLGEATATSINGSTIPSSKTLVVTTDKLDALSATTSSELAGVISDETGTGNVVLSTSPTLTGTPTLPTGTIGVTQTSGNSSTAIATTAFVGDAVSTAVGASVADAINDGTTTIAPSQNAVFDALVLKEDAINKSIDGTFASNSDVLFPTEKATKTYVDAQVTTATTGNFVDLTTSQTIAGAKTFSADIKVGTLEIKASAENQSTLIGTGVTSSTGINITAIGFMALNGNTGIDNTAIGSNTMRNSGATSGNTAIGNSAGGDNGANTGGNNTFIGKGAVLNYVSTPISNATAIGNGSVVATSNIIQLGNTAVTNVKTSGTITAGVVTYPNTHNSTAGQVLITDASGVANWGSAAATVREVADEFSATSSQTSFTLTQTPSAKSKVKMYINGIRISNTAYSVSGATLTYTEVNNGNYTLTASDRVQFDYFY
jgi:hypothetical protein